MSVVNTGTTPAHSTTALKVSALSLLLQLSLSVVPSSLALQPPRPRIRASPCLPPSSKSFGGSPSSISSLLPSLASLFHIPTSAFSTQPVKPLTHTLLHL